MWRTDIENAPKDGSTVVFPVEIEVRAYWDNELGWVTVREVKINRVRDPKRWRPG